MIQESINTLVGILDKYPETYKLEIIDNNHVILHWSTTEFHSKEFESAIEMLEWLENKYD